ncbi:hypothetical protein HU200_031753 [Digitaria exilis]|uniref:Uncharacterized protein n=1 Tax=Digitaria exilis TaxID=1010633 RepID=A0A835ET32_9POAL|nr:hypothetical protein HU200_031753 [Digitaria exilis]CAB3484990.1 unnamed protein product [Digitaria exilis]CAB3487507.1 unnamed protein product [Digitaria exilis]
MLLHSLLVQKMAKNTRQPRKEKDGGGARSGAQQQRSPWYQRAVEVLLLIWKQPASTATTTTKAAAASGVTSSASGKGGAKLRKSSSLNVAASFTRVCLCAPISSYNTESLYCFQAGDAAAPRRSYSYPRASSASASGCGVSPLVAPPPAAEHANACARGRASGGGKSGVVGERRVFRGKSLTDDILMRRFVVDEEATRRRNEMEVIRRRHAAASKRRRLGPSPLRRMALPESELEADDEPEATGNSVAAAVA